ncbi:MAG: NAD(P)H:quinone oxidoreductase [Halothiobacillaceae bacterium]
MAEILILFYSRDGSTARMAHQVMRGVESVEGCIAKLRAIPPISTNCKATEPSVPPDGAPYVTQEDFQNCDGLALGTPTYFGNMAGAVKHFIDTTSGSWFSGRMVGKPAGVFTSTASQHGGQEATLLSMMIPLLHHGMIIVGLPYTEPALTRTQAGGSPYGPTHTAGGGDRPLTSEERALCQALGSRIARTALAFEGRTRP